MRIPEIRNNFVQNFLPKLKNIFGKKVSVLEKQPVTDVFEKRIISDSGIKSNTVKKLFSEEFMPQRKFDKNGCRVTTIIDRKTQKPVEAFVARVETDEPLQEQYIIMVKDKNGEIEINSDKFKNVGKTYFYIDKQNGVISPKFELINKDGVLYEKVKAYMKSNGNKDYQGIGARLHQLRIERMLQEKLGNVMIVAEGNSFPFHYNMGFRLQPEVASLEDMEKVIKILSEINNKDGVFNKKFIQFVYSNGEKMIDYSRTLENCLNDYYKNGGKALEFEPNMFLDAVSAKEWIDYIVKQPILF